MFLLLFFRATAVLCSACFSNVIKNKFELFLMFRYDNNLKMISVEKSELKSNNIDGKIPKQSITCLCIIARVSWV